MIEQDDLTEEDKAFLAECRNRGVADEFLNYWFDRYWAAYDKNLPLPGSPWHYKPIGKLRFTPDITVPETIDNFTNDDREELLLLLQYS